MSQDTWAVLEKVFDSNFKLLGKVSAEDYNRMAHGFGQYAPWTSKTVLYEILALPGAKMLQALVLERGKINLVPGSMTKVIRENPDD